MPFKHNFTYRVTTEAALDILEAAIYLEANRRGYARKFREELTKLFNFLCENPESAPVLYQDRRKIYLRTFKYHVIYTINEPAQELEIIMVIHHSRHPRRWEKN